MMDDCLIVGGGVIGLSIAWQMARHGARVRLLDRSEPATEASWAGAGILPPGSDHADADPLEQLGAWSSRLHITWSAELRETTGIDNGYRRTGGLYLATGAALAEELRTTIDQWQREGVNAVNLDRGELLDIEPALHIPVGQEFVACRLPDEAQIRNPWHLRALLVACVQAGVQVDAGVEVNDFVVRGRRVELVRTNVGDLAAGAVCLCGGAWTGGLAQRLGLTLPVAPVRGQMVLLRTMRPVLRHVVNLGPRYLVPRCDGRLLVGSTEENVGFDKRTTAGAIGGLLELATRLAPELQTARFETCWAGLRPGTRDRLPCLGAVPDCDNAFVAAGHFRSGLQLSPATAVVIGQLLRGESPERPLQAFRPDRFAN